MGTSPFLYPQAWDVILIGGEGGTPSPGIARVSPCKKHNEWDVRRGKGAQGASYTYNGLEPARFTITFEFWSYPGLNGNPNAPDHYALWLAFVPLFNYDPTRKTVQAVDLYHPSLDDIGVQAIITEDIGNWVAKGTYYFECICSFITYLPAPNSNASASPTAAILDVPDVNSEKPLTDQQLLAQLQTQAASPK